MLALSNIALTTFGENNQAIKDLYTIFSETLNKNYSYEEFLLFYFQGKPHYMDISFIKTDGRIIGFMCVAFYKHLLGSQTYTVCRGATGMKEEYRGGHFPSWNFYRKFIEYKLKHPFEKLYIIAYVANPLVYSMICKNAYKVYPKDGVSIPPSISRLREKILEFNGFSEKEIAPFVLKIHFQVNISLKDEERIFSSNDKYVQYYLDRNPYFQKQIGIMTIIPVSWRNISACTIRSLKKPLKRFVRRNFEIRNRHPWEGEAG